MLHLRLAGLTVTGDGLLDLFSRKFANRETLIEQGHQNRPPGLAKFEGRAGILGKEDILNRRILGKMGLDNVQDPIVDLF